MNENLIKLDEIIAELDNNALGIEDKLQRLADRGVISPKDAVRRYEIFLAIDCMAKKTVMELKAKGEKYYNRGELTGRSSGRVATTGATPAAHKRKLTHV